MSIYERFANIRELKGQNRERFAQTLGTQGSVVSAIESGKREPSKAVMLKMRESCGVSIDWLLTGEGPMFLEQEESPRVTLPPQNNIEDQGEVISNSAKSVPSAHEVLTSWIQSLDDEEAANVLKYLLDLPLKKRKKKK